MCPYFTSEGAGPSCSRQVRREERGRGDKPPVPSPSHSDSSLTLLLDGFYSHLSSQLTTTHISRKLLLPLPSSPSCAHNALDLRCPGANSYCVVCHCHSLFSPPGWEFRADRDCVLSLFSPSKWNMGPGTEPGLKKHCLHE